MKQNSFVSRRTFVGGLAVALGSISMRQAEALAQAAQARGGQGMRGPNFDYDAMAKIANNENPYGMSENVKKAFLDAYKYHNRYGYPDGGITQAIAEFHKVKPENVLLGAGSSEILKVIDDTFLMDHKKVVGVDPTYESVYRYATNSKAEAIKVPLLSDYRMDVPGIIKATKANYRDVGFVYICNPNNPTGNIIPKQEIKMLIDGIPGDVPILIDEAYHHFVDDPNYESAEKYVIEGRPVIVARTFSKIAALAGLRLGYSIAPKDLTDRMRPFALSSINAMVKHAGVASLKDTVNEREVARKNSDLRKKVTGELNAMGFPCIPSQTNFFMVHAKREVTPVIDEFRKRGVLVGRRFPPMVEHLRVSIGTPEEMDRFMVAFKEILGAGKTSSSSPGR